jgi:polysaccharide export outer membrane protein
MTGPAPIRRSVTAGRLTIAAIIGSLIGGVVMAGTNPAVQESAPQATQGVVEDPSLRLGPADLLSIRVSGVGEFTGIRVSNSGKIRVPHVGVVKVYQMTLAELEAELTRLFRERGFVKDPWIEVVVQQRRGHVAYVLGEVLMPGQFVINGRMRILDVLALAGGMNEFSTPVGYLYRRTAVLPEADDPSGTSIWKDEVIEVDFEALMSGETPEADLEIVTGDVLYVPERRKLLFYVVGDVGKPGAFEFPQRGAHPLGSALSTAPLRITEAVGKAGGTLKTAKLSDVMLVRFGADGVRSDTRLDLGRIMRGRDEDLVLQPNDIVYVPGSVGKSFGYSLVRIVPGVMLGHMIYR